MNLVDLLRPLDLIFRKNQIRYAMIGGYAVAAWGEERATRDVDLLCGAGDSKLLTSALNSGRIPYEHRIGDSDDPISEVIRIETGSAADPAEVDILIGIRGAPAGILDRARIVRIGSFAIPVASPEDMVILKLLGGSARDIEDATTILHLQGDKLDIKLTKRLCPGRLRGLLAEAIKASRNVR
jgi:predicted nucleotidyltransferase